MATSRDEILNVVRDVLGPLVRADGGELYLVSSRPDAVTLHLTGRFAGCPGNTLATRRVLEPAVHAVSPGTQVVVSSGAIIPKGATLVEK